jgi:hypothetical protein
MKKRTAFAVLFLYVDWTAKQAGEQSRRLGTGHPIAPSPATLLAELAPLRTAQVDPWIADLLLAFAANSKRFIFPELDHETTVWARHIEDVFCGPISLILSGATSHHLSPLHVRPQHKPGHYTSIGVLPRRNDFILFLGNFPLGQPSHM